MPIDMTPDDFKEIGYQVVDLLAAHLADVQNPMTSTRRSIPNAVRERFLWQALPEDRTDVQTLLDRVREEVLPYPMGNASPRFFAWVNSPPAPIGVLAEFIAAAHNASSAGGDHAATYIEHATLNWLKEMMGYPPDASGILTSGGSMANLVGLAAMRFAKANRNVREYGLKEQPAPMVVYTSTQGHSSIQKAIELLGIGSRYLRKIPVDDEYRIRIDALRASIVQDRIDNLQPACVAVSAGTVNTGAIDPLDELAVLCADENLWLHVDGSYGAVGILGEGMAPNYEGIERADSIALDPHKWLYVPIECGCALVRDESTLRGAFSLVPPYIRDDRALPWFAEYGPQQTRGFKALKLWMMLQHIGVNGYRESITRDIQLTKILCMKIDARDDFELVTSGPLSIVCFRYTPAGFENLDTLNREIPASVQASEQAFLTGTQLDGKSVLRACIVNFRTRERDLDLLLDTVAEQGQQIIAGRQM